ncbi:uncharacterized protein LACBIDRAFT_325628 [Laccaria bicolor S238N-H82]|uniref:alkaline phosphatase n=1 Tax=Laccaria bicolor (strain S238N-H82 / ATCC MYA-4686) TaxID=486041 RepID=B0D5P6_LACBS|nr:uncharacterized protein LACBIDRAFT_325628 [Laccaria bicolor S238N-H82]EDR09809.1 predicted protein [Laccaria bicolor S238N-H82]|eukprot:XP_001879194.1 predicted protein [Laccaria bicolor S238N-H82]
MRVPDEKLTFCIQGGNGPCKDVTKFLKVKEPALEKWTFQLDPKTSTVVNVASKAYRASPTVAEAQPSPTDSLINLLLNAQPRVFSSSLAMAMITAARLIVHKSINGKYQFLMQMDQMDNLGFRMTHSINSFITDSATALYTGKKLTVNALGVYVDSLKPSLSFSVIALVLGIVPTAYIADVTFASLCSYTGDRGQYASIVTEYLYTQLNICMAYQLPRTKCHLWRRRRAIHCQRRLPSGTDFYKVSQVQGYNVIHNNTQLQAAGTKDKMLGI